MVFPQKVGRWVRYSVRPYVMAGDAIFFIKGHAPMRRRATPQRYGREGYVSATRHDSAPVLTPQHETFCTQRITLRQAGNMPADIKYTIKICNCMVYGE